MLPYLMVFRYSCGVLPVSFLKSRMKYEWSLNPNV